GTIPNIGVWGKIGVAVLGILAAILTSLNTFLGLSERTEKHRSAGVQYKIVIRELERILSAHPDNSSGTDHLPAEIQKRLDDLEESAPVVPERLYDCIEAEWKKRGVQFKGKACELYHHGPDRTDDLTTRSVGASETTPRG